MDTTLRATDLRRSFRIGAHTIDVLRGISLEVPAGQCAFLVGASGAGKTTLLYTLAGLEQPDSGRVTLAGADIYAGSDAVRARRRNERMGFVFQNCYLLPELTALENTALPALIGGRVARERAAELLTRVGLGERLAHLPCELSGGEQQRVAIARALINDPCVLFADEPTGNLDAATGAGVMDLLLSLVGGSTGKSLVVVTHDARLAGRGGRRITLAKGEIIEDLAQQQPAASH